MPEYLTPGVYFEFLDAAPPTLLGTRVDVCGIIGIAERGPLNQAIRIESWRQFQAVFGNFVPYAYLAYAVYGFFENGGRTCFPVRVAGVNAAKAQYLLKNAGGVPVLNISALNEGTWGNRIAITLTAVKPAAGLFSILITRDLINRESFQNLSLNPDDSNYFVNVINDGLERTSASQCVRVADLLPAGVPRTPAFLPDSVGSKLVNESQFLTGGQDGLASLTRSDFLGDPDPLSPDTRGLAALWNVDDVGVVCIPDIHIQPSLRPQPPPSVTPPRDPCRPCPVRTLPLPASILPDQAEQPPAFSENDVFELQRSLLEQCERRGDRVAILDVPVHAGSGNSYNLTEVQEWRSRFDSERGFGAMYYPWVRVLDPIPGLDPLRSVPSCGHLAGTYAGNDFTVGVFKSPANTELAWAEDLTVDIEDEEQAILNPMGVNCLRALPGRGLRPYGARTLSDDPDWIFLCIRRTLQMIERAIYRSMQWTVFEPNNSVLRQTLGLSIANFLFAFWKKGGLAGSTVDEAFYVRCDATNNPQEAAAEGRLLAEIGVAPVSPAEFITFRIGRTADELELVET
jgi:phage tail sheath protein FI